MIILRVFLFFFLMAVQIMGQEKIISGQPAEVENPGFFNTVALVKEDGTIFCTGSLVADQIIATAKHCLVDKKDQKIRVYFGDDTTEPIQELYREVVASDTRYETDWTMTFPSFDVAWVRFKGSAPEPFKPLPVLSDFNKLEEGMDIIQVGYGDHHPNPSQIEAGQKLWGKTKLKRVILNSRFFYILLFDGNNGQGSCHGDSGGPAYVQIEGQWYIIGVTNGFDLVLTPDAMIQTDDPDFPFKVDCSQNQSLYTFLGAHGHWMEESSQTILSKSEVFTATDRDETPESYSSLLQWCESRDFGSPQWNLLKILLDKRVDEIGQREAAEFYEDCDKVVPFLQSISRIKLDYNSVQKANLSFEPLSLMPRLKELYLANYPKALLNLKSIKGLFLESLTLRNLGLETLNFLQVNSIESLSLEHNPLYSLNGIHNIKNLTSLNLSNTAIKDVRVLAPFKIESLSLIGLNVPIVLGLDTLSENLKYLDISNTIVSSVSAISRMKNLEVLRASGDNSPLILKDLTKLKEIYLKDFKEGQIEFPIDLGNLEKITASQCDLNDITFLHSADNVEDINFSFNRIGDLFPFRYSTFPKLKTLNLSGNPILNVSPLASLNSLEILRVFRTPLQRGQVPKTEDNCPTTHGSEVLRNFCEN